MSPPSHVTIRDLLLLLLLLFRLWEKMSSNLLHWGTEVQTWAVLLTIQIKLVLQIYPSQTMGHCRGTEVQTWVVILTTQIKLLLQMGYSVLSWTIIKWTLPQIIQSCRGREVQAWALPPMPQSDTCAPPTSTASVQVQYSHILYTVQLR